ncbi:PAS domain S-box protein [Parvicella tangerina]|uniref:Anaerobic nitric oxide reductase transcription regulator NorR n=1 Tax=Parvicella tangerina TaxID=2829795 RepID=A0A916JKE8_9FLAO|nr:PAS domain S-box protein [Parvicella tangerina]CAG5078840.1 Anaerobic nitric oxide reductase transcription regulator NorR [Parvicella tangerina]
MKSPSENKIEFDDLSLVASSISQAVIIISPEDIVEWVNEAFEKIYGFTLAEVQGNKIVDFVGGPEMDPLTLANIEKAIFKDHVPIKCELIQYKKDRSTFWGELNLTPILDEHGNMKKYISVVQDVTDRKTAMINLEASQVTFNQITSSINDVYYLYNIQFQRYEFISPNVKEIMGAEQDFFYNGESYNNTYAHPDDRPILQTAYEGINRGIPYEIEYRVLIDGRTRWIREKSFPIVDFEGNLIKNSGVCQDITDYKTTENSLHKARENASLLSDLGLEISAEIDLSNIVGKVYERFNEIMEVDAFGIGVLDEDQEQLRFPLFVENNNRYEDYTIPLADRNKLATICFHNNQDLIIRDSEVELSNYINNLGPLIGEVTKSIIYLPLLSENKVVGVLTVQSFNKYAYDSYSLSLIKNLTVFISVALKKAMVYREMEEIIEKRTAEIQRQKDVLEETYRRTRLVSEIGYRLTSSLDLEEIFLTLYENIKDLMSADMFGIRIVNKEAYTIDYKFEIEHGERQSPVAVSMSDTDNYSVWTVLNKKEILIGDNRKEYSKYVNEIKVPIGEMPNSLIFFPLMDGKDVIGVITIQSMKYNAFDEGHVNILKSLASYTASAITKASLYDTLENKVIDRTKELQETNKNLVDSINYAKRIHDNIRPGSDRIKNLFEESFVLFKPKDIISGDFYLIDEIKTNTGKCLKAIVIGDCTGHGVPGGILSVLCSNLVRQTFKNRDVNSPAQALNVVSEDLTQLLATNDELRLRDGMDVTFCVIDEEERMLFFAGANNSCFVVRGTELIRLRGDRQHVGYTENFKPFSDHALKLESGDQIYITTDGFIDQFGGENFKKFMLRRFLDLISQNSSVDFNGQKKLLEEAFHKWKGSGEQTDDVCVFGARVL